MSQQGPPQEAIQKLPVFQTVVTASVEVFSNLPSLAKAAALPFAISLGISFLAWGSSGSPGTDMLLGLLGLIPYTYFGVAWHRYVLLGAERATPSTLPPLAPRHGRFLFFAGLLFLVYALPNIAINQAAQPLLEVEGQPDPELAAEVFAKVLPFFAILIVAFVLTLRFSFVFPAVAVDENYGLGDSWRHARGQTLRLFLGLVLLVLPLALTIVIVVSALTAATAGGSNLPAILASVALNYLGTGLTLAFISTAFRECTGWVPDEATSPSSPAPMDESRD